MSTGKRCNVNQEDSVSEFRADYIKYFYTLQKPSAHFYKHKEDHYISILIQPLGKDSSFLLLMNNIFCAHIKLMFSMQWLFRLCNQSRHTD